MPATSKARMTTTKMADFLLNGFSHLSAAAAALKINRESIVINVPRAAGSRRPATSHQSGSGSFFVPAAILLLLHLVVSCAVLAQAGDLANSRPGDKQATQYSLLSSPTQHKRSRRDITAEPLSSRSQELALVSLAAASTVPAANANFEAAFQGECGKNNNSNPCGHICLDLYDGTYECSCFYGFTLAVDGYSCTPVAPPIPTAASLGPPVLAQNGTVSSRQASRLQSTKSHQSTTSAASVLTTESPAETATARYNVGGLSNVPMSGLPEAIKSDEHSTGSLKGGAVAMRISGDGDGGGTPFFIEDANDIRKLAYDLSSGVKLREIGLLGWTDAAARPAPRDRHQNDKLAILNRKRRLLEAALKNHSQGRPQKALPSLLSKHPSKHTVSGHKGNHNHHYLTQHLNDPPESTTITSGPGATVSTSSVVYAPEQAMLESEIIGSRLESASGTTDNNQADWPARHNRLLAHPEAANKQSLMEPGVEFIELAGGSHQTHADIKSIMLANNRLLAELVRSVEAGLATPTTSLGVASDQRQLYELHQDHHHHHHDTHADQYESSGLRLLDDLIRKSVDDFRALGAHFQWTAARLEEASSQPADGPTSEVVVAPAATGKPALLEAAPGSDVATGASAGAVYSNCGQLPECQAGGLCTTDQVDPGAPSAIKGRARCRCPLGRAGLLCQRAAQMSVPRFSGHSYLALPLPDNHLHTAGHLKQLRLVFRPTQASADGLASLLLSAPSFTLLLDALNRVQLSYTSRWGLTRVMGSRDARLNSWNELIVTPDASNDSNMIEQQQHANPGDATSRRRHANNIPDRIVLVTPAEIPLAGPQEPPHPDSRAASELFVGGLPEFAAGPQENRTEAAADAQDGAERPGSLPGGLRGCIRELSINGRAYNFGSDFKGDALDGFDITDCAL